MSDAFDALGVGGGQAGLVSGYHLERAGLSFAILEAGEEPGGSWPGYYESLRLFSPARYSGLPGLPFPGLPDRYPTRDEVVAYLRGYAEAFVLPVLTGRRVVRAERAGSGFRLLTDDSEEHRARTLSPPRAPSRGRTAPGSRTGVFRRPRPARGRIPRPRAVPRQTRGGRRRRKLRRADRRRVGRGRRYHPRHPRPAALQAPGPPWPGHPLLAVGYGRGPQAPPGVCGLASTLAYLRHSAYAFWRLFTPSPAPTARYRPRSATRGIQAIALPTLGVGRL